MRGDFGLCLASLEIITRAALAEEGVETATPYMVECVREDGHRFRMAVRNADHIGHLLRALGPPTVTVRTAEGEDRTMLMGLIDGSAGVH